MSGRHWRVAVSIDGEEVLAIEPDMLCGIPDIDDFADEVRTAGENLLAFIGNEEPSTFLLDEDDTHTPVSVPATSDGADLEAAREALEPFAAIADLYDGAEDDDFEVWKDIGSMRSIRTVSELRHFRRARAALRRRREDETGSNGDGT